MVAYLRADGVKLLLIPLVLFRDLDFRPDIAGIGIPGTLAFRDLHLGDNFVLQVRVPAFELVNLVLDSECFADCLFEVHDKFLVFLAAGH